jgi:hypothetical protein
MKTTNFRLPQRLLLGFTAIIGMQAGIHAASVPDVPEQIKSPAGERLVFQAHASGAQIYTCQQGADGQSQWTLKAPDAQLHDQKGAVVGHHYAGPAWKHNDGSEVTGKAAAKVDSPDPDSIPWLLITATGHSGAGVFAQVTSIQRIHTKGGHAPAAASCDSSKLGAEAKIPYTADYYFYAPAK